MGNLSDPVTYRRVHDALLAKGYSESEIKAELDGRVSMEQAPQAVERGLISAQEAFTGVGGISQPGAVGLFGDVKKEPAGEKERLFLRTAEIAKEALGILEGGEIETGPITTNIQKIKEKIPGAQATAGTRFRSKLDFANTMLKNALLGGQISPQEYKSIKDALPSATDQEDIVDQKLREFINAFGGAYGVTVPAIKGMNGNEELPQETGMVRFGGLNAPPPSEGQMEQLQTQPTNGMGTQPPQLQGAAVANVPTDDTSAIESFAEAMPVVFGIAGGIGGGIAGVPTAIPTLGGSTVVGSAIGTTIGTATGVAVENMIKSLALIQDESSKEQLTDATTQAAVAGVTDLAFGSLFKAVTMGGGFLLKSVTKGVDNIPLRGIRVNPSQLTNFKKQYGVDLAEFMVDNKLMGDDVLTLTGNKAEALQEMYDQYARSKSIAIPKNKLKKRFAEEILDLAGATPTGQKTKLVPKFNKKIAKDVLGEWENIMTQLDSMGVDEVTPEMLTNMRNQIDEVIPKSQWVDPGTRNVALRIRRILNDVVYESVDATLLGKGEAGSIRKMGIELSKYYKFLEIAEKQSNLGRGSLLPNLTRIGTAGGGAAVGAQIGGVPGAAIGGTLGLGIEAMLRDPEVLYRVYKAARAAQKAGNVLSKSQVLQILTESASKGVPPTLGVGVASLTQQ